MLGIDEGFVLITDEGLVLGAGERVSDGETLGVTEGVGPPGSGLLPMSLRSKLINSSKNFNN
jgi:hypothetical protein